LKWSKGGYLSGKKLLPFLQDSEFIFIKADELYRLPAAVVK
jgi:hypothetical protein